MTKLRNISVLRIISSLILASFLIFSGCTEGPFTTHEKKTLATTLYEERCIINAEPPGCRIYVQNKFVGVSPIEIVLNGREAQCSRIGHYNYVHDYPLVSAGDYVPPARRTSPTRWQHPRWAPKTGGTWTIKAFKEGYETATYVVKYGDEVFAKAFVNVGSYDVPEKVIGTRNLLLELRPISLAAKSNQAFGNRSFQEQDSGRRPVDKAAKAEYEQALAAYNEALKKLNDARALAIARRSMPMPQGGSKFMRGTQGLMNMLEPINLAELETKVQIARERLERAKARIDHSEW